MSDDLIDSLVTYLSTNQLHSESARVLRAREAAAQSIRASQVSRASRERAAVTPVPDDILRTAQALPEAAAERRGCKDIQLHRARHVTT
jgi:hypothetical protein